MSVLLAELMFESVWNSDIVDVGIIAYLAAWYFKPDATMRVIAVSVALASKTRMWVELPIIRFWKRCIRSAFRTERGSWVAVIKFSVVRGVTEHSS